MGDLGERENLSKDFEGRERSQLYPREEHCRQNEELDSRPYTGSEPGRNEEQQGDEWME